MQTDRFVHFLGRVLAIFAAFTILPRGTFATNIPQIIYSFAGGSDGEYLDTDLVIDSAGNLYGTSVQGGDYGSGTVWELSPSGNGRTHTVLYSFRGGTDGGEPYKGATLDAQGNLYGTAVTGGGGSCEGGCGVIWKLTRSGSSWTQSVIHTFTGGDDGSGRQCAVYFRCAAALSGNPASRTSAPDPQFCPQHRKARPHRGGGGGVRHHPGPQKGRRLDPGRQIGPAETRKRSGPEGPLKPTPAERSTELPLWQAGASIPCGRTSAW